MYLLFDIGGTKTRLAVSEDLASIEERVKFDTPPLFEDGIARFIDAAEQLLQGRTVRALAGGIRGPLNHEKTGIISDTVLTDWVKKPLGEALAQEFSAPVHLENDTAMVGMGEAHFGAGRGYDIVAYHTVSTGVGGARIVHGAIDAASIGFEPGKQIVDLDYTKLGGATDTLEELISGESLEHRRGVKPYEIPQSDPVWEELARYLATGLKNTVAYWSPDVIVLGGSMVVGDPRIPLGPIRLHMNALLAGLMPCPPIFDATLKDEGGLFGAMAVLKQRMKADVTH